jgi:hypothetical protein
LLSAQRWARVLPARWRDPPNRVYPAVPILNSPHISAREAATVRYNSLPPTSGPHFSFPAATGMYDTEVPDAATVHALEHGHVAIQYAPGSTKDTIARLVSLAKRYAGDVVLAPYPRLPHGIALTAWGRIDTLDNCDEARIAAFIERLRNRYSHGWTCAGCCVTASC